MLRRWTTRVKILLGSCARSAMVSLKRTWFPDKPEEARSAAVVMRVEMVTTLPPPRLDTVDFVTIELG